MLQSGRVTFGVMDAVIFGRPAAEVLAEEARRREAERVFLMVSGTLNRTTDEIEKVRRSLGNRFAGIFDRMPPHTPRRAVIEAAAVARRRRRSDRHNRRRLGDGRGEGGPALSRKQHPQR